MLFRSKAAAGAVGLVLAFSPHLARVSTSESPFAWACLLLPVCLASTLAFVSGRDWRMLATAFLSNLLLVHLHLTTVPFLVLPLVVLVASPRAERNAAALPLLGAFAAGAILAFPHVTSQWHLNVAEGLGSVWTDPAFLLAPFSARNLFVLPATTPVVVSVLSAAGLAVAWFKFRRSAVVLTACLPLLLGLFAAATCFVDLVRYQSVAKVLLTLPLGAVAAALAMLPGRKGPSRNDPTNSGTRASLPTSLFFIGIPQAGVAVLLSLLLAFELTRVTSTHVAPDVEAQQFRFLAKSVRLLPERGLLVLPPKVREYRAGNYFPRKLLVDSGKSFSVVYADEFQERVRRDGWPEEDVFFFQSLQTHQVELALQDPALSDISPESIPQVEGRIGAWREFLARHSAECIASEWVRSPDRVVASVPMEFNRQPEGPLPLSLCRLAQAPDVGAFDAGNRPAGAPGAEASGEDERLGGGRPGQGGP